MGATHARAPATGRVEEFYDVVADPHETRDLIADPKYTRTISELRARLIRWRKQQGDFRSPAREDACAPRFSTPLLNTL